MIKNIKENPIHLGLGATAVSEPAFSGMEWYAEYAKRHEKDGKEGRLISMYTFNTPWDMWEMHPHGSEVVLCISGQMTLIQEIKGSQKKTTLNANEYAINPPAVWHTADVKDSATALFITAGEGTEHRAREIQ